MKANIRFFYCRISTKKQSITKQVELAKQYIRMHPDKTRSDRIITEQYSGAKDRPKFDTMIKNLRPNDQVIVIRLDRFSRSLRIALNAIHQIRLHQCTMKVLTPFPMWVIKKVGNQFKPANEAQVDMLLLFAQWERKAIYHRTRLGYEIASRYKKNFKAGRKTREKSKWFNRYKDIYNYSKTHSITMTTKHFHNVHGGKHNGRNISRREVFYIRSMFKNKHKHRNDKLH